MRISDWSSDVCSSDLLEQFGVDPADVDLHAIGDAAVDERFVERFIGILKADIFADDADRDLALGTLQPLDDLGPARQIGRAAGRDPERLPSTDERRGGKEGVSTCRYLWSPVH